MFMLQRGSSRAVKTKPFQTRKLYFWFSAPLHPNKCHQLLSTLPQFLGFTVYDLGFSA